MKSSSLHALNGYLHSDVCWNCSLRRRICSLRWVICFTPTELTSVQVDRWDLYRRAQPAAPKHDFAIGVHALHHTSKFALTVVVARGTQAFVCKMLGLLAAPASTFLAINNVMDHHLVVARVSD